MINWIRKLFGKCKKINYGHRLGFEYYDSVLYPENSMAALNAVISDGIQNLDNYRYTEFDVCESKDGILYCFHDETKRKTVKRMCPTAPKALRNKRISELYSCEIDSLRLLGTDEGIPHVSEVIVKLTKHATKPVAIEIKKLMTWDAQYILISLVEQANLISDQEFYFMMFKKKLKKMPNGDKFLDLCKLCNIRFEVM